jgi:hypothetical protein
MNVGLAELLLIGIAALFLVLWVMGVAKLFAKGRDLMGAVAIVGLLLPPVALIGYAGWFVEDRSAADTG